METPDFLMKRIDKFGGPEAYNHYAVGWAHAMDTPYQWTKQVASHWGGTRNGTIVHWPNGIKAKGEVRSQFCHVIDVAPTVLEAAGLPEPTVVNGVQQEPARGHEHALQLRRRQGAGAARDPVLRDVLQPGHLSQGLERGDPALARRGSWQTRCPPSTTTSGSSTTGARTGRRRATLSKEMPEKLHELQRLWLIEAAKYNVLPLDDRRLGALQSGPRRPAAALIKGNSQLLFGGMGRLTENCVVDHEEQVLLDHGRGGGARPRAPKASSSPRAAPSAAGASTPRTGRPSSPTTSSGSRSSPSRPTQQIPPGTHQVRMEFAYDGGGLAKGGKRHALLRRREGRRGPCRAHRAHGLLRRRDDRRRPSRAARRCRPDYTPETQRLQRQDQLGADRPGQGRPRSPDQPGGAPAAGDEREQ